MFLNGTAAMLQRTLAGARPILTVGLDLMLRRYPQALYGGLDSTELPVVLCFHSAQPEPFEDLLRFLAGNGYRTLIAEEFAELVRQGAPGAGRRAVLLTFDDGMGQVWSVIYPLLKKYGMRATCFLIPARIQESSNGPGPSLEDVWRGEAPLTEVETRDASDRPFATWEEIAVMHHSGVIDFQNHTWDHRLIVTSSEIVDFVSPQVLERFHPFEFSMFRNGDTEMSLERPPLGSPIYTTAARFSDARRFQPDPAVAAACVEHVAANGGAVFFERPGWRQQLLDVAGTADRGGGDYETEAERRSVLAPDLARAKAAIEARLPGHEVRHFCLPWGEGSAAAVDAARETGHETCFWTKVDGRLVNHAGGDPFRIARIGEDFARSLPGEGRVPLRQVVIRKFENRVRRGTPYLSH